MESIYDYGARAGFWRVFRLFEEFALKPTVYGVATALARSPEQVAAMKEAGWEIASHGLKWVEHKDMDEAEERAHIAEAIRLHTEVVGAPPEGWYTGRCSVNTLRLVAETGQFAYVSDTYDDDLPYWARIGERDQLIIPYTLDANDMRFATPQGFNTGDHFFTYLKDSFDALYAEGMAGAPKMMSIGLAQPADRPAGPDHGAAPVHGLRRRARGRVVPAPDRDRPALGGDPSAGARIDLRPSQMSRPISWRKFGGDFRTFRPGSPSGAFELELGPAHDSAAGLHNALARVFRSALARAAAGACCTPTPTSPASSPPPSG